MGLSLVTLSLSKKYVNDTVKGLGAIKGSPCTIKDISKNETGSIITFEWTAVDGTKQTTQLNVLDGKNGINGKDGINGTPGKNGDLLTDITVKNLNNNYYLICTITDANGRTKEVNAGQLPVYQPEIATKNRAGIIKIGNNLEIAADGTLSAVYKNNTESNSLQYSATKPTISSTIGSMVFNKNPKPNGYVGWVYTTFGWLGFGMIENTDNSEIVIPENTFTFSDGSQYLVKDNLTNEYVPFLYKDDIIVEEIITTFTLRNGDKMFTKEGIPFLYK